MTLQRLLGIELPIIQAPMAGVQGSALAVAVSNAGGLGSLPCAMLSVDAMRRELTAIRERTDKPYNVNFFCHVQPPPDAARETAWRQLLAPYYAEHGIDATALAPGAGRSPFSAEHIGILEEFRPPVVSFHFGLPAADLVARVRGWGAKILSSATTVEEARWLESRGVDAIIAQGVEAGGHRGLFLSEDLGTQVGTFALVPQLVRAVGIPVIAAGGIADAAGVAAVLALGAAGVQIGTAYLLCPEATTSTVHRNALEGDLAHITALTNLFTGRPARGIVNRVMRELGFMNPAVPPFPLATTAIAPLRAKAESLGSGDFSPLWAGQNVGGCREISAGLLTQELASGSTRVAERQATIDHIALWTRDLERSKAFYVTYLGARAGSGYVNPRKGFESCFLSFDGGARIEIMKTTTLSPLSIEAGVERMGLTHFAVSLGSEQRVDALTQRLKDDGHPVLDGPRRTGDGYYESVVLDPDGNRIELTV